MLQALRDMTNMYTLLLVVLVLKNFTEVKEIGQLNVINPDKSLLPILKDESENLNPLIEFVKEEGEKNQNISDTLPEEIGQDTVGKGNKFVKVTMTPNASDEDKPDGSSGGPWKVYNSKLLNLEKDKKIPDYVLTRRVIFTNDDSITSSKYRSITVYYSTKGGKDYKALLVEFYASDMEYKTYFKRGDAEGTEWANETISTSNVDEGVLTRIAKEAKIIQEGSSVSSKGRPIGPSLPISGSSSSDVGGGGSVGVDSGAKGGHGSSSSRPVERGETSTRGTTGPSGENGDSGGNGNSNSDRGDGNTSRNEGVALTNDNHHSVSDSSTTYGQTSPQTKEKKDDKSDDSVSKKLKLAGAGVATTAIGAGAIGGGAHYAHGVLSVVNWLI
ncbi:hypothetical protein MACJ_002406 [Theileria orientalis]|uniref:Uncharacterized protein n=1 Tax=Theileria orientalis TaxID=68886 RepID=A0A976M8J1_THEOR|nr:hypothetical protein MACJ_002406 [Theileria orientalis]